MLGSDLQCSCKNNVVFRRVSAIINAGSGIVICSVVLVEELQYRGGGGEGGGEGGRSEKQDI